MTNPAKTNYGMWVLIAAIAAVALTRLLPHPPNFAPVVAVALFGGAALRDRKLAFMVPMAAMFLADLIIGFHQTMLFTYTGMAAVVLIGMVLSHNRRPWKLAVAGVTGSLVFFLISNFGMWLNSGFYPATASGLAACLGAALPFFHNTLSATLVYGALLFFFESRLKRSGHNCTAPERAASRQA